MNLVSRDGRAPKERRATVEPVDWLDALQGPEPGQAMAMRHLHGLMLKAARHQVWRMRGQLAGTGVQAIEEIANQSADEAMVTLLGKLHTFEGRSRFTTWAYKFAMLQAATDVRRQAWRHREVEVHDVDTLLDRSPGPEMHAVATDLAHAVTRAMDAALTPHQRRIAIALLVDEVPIDVLAERLGSSRGALYKTLHDARTRLRVP